MGDAYSSFGRTRNLYACNFTCCGVRRSFADEMMLRESSMKDFYRK